jgi:nucleotide-binding universal stress UspA family protein
MLPEIRKILYSTDLSPGSYAALEQALYIAKKTGAEIIILHLVEKLSDDARFTLQTYLSDSGSRYELLRQRIKHAQQRLEDSQEHFWQQHPDEEEVRQQIKSIHIAEAYPAEAILKVSQDKGVDLIVMGTHEKGVMHTFLGSVAKNVLGRSRIPMLVVPLPEH